MSDDLRELIELWRMMADSPATPVANATTLRWCSDELESTLDDLEGGK